MMDIPEEIVLKESTWILGDRQSHPVEWMYGQIE